MARGRSAATLACLFALLGANGARAGATVDLLFVGLDGAPIAATNNLELSPGSIPGSVLTMAVVVRNDEPLTIAVFSLNYDLDGDNELDVVSAFQWGGVPLNKQATDFFAPIAGLAPTTATFVGSFQGATTNFSGPRVLPAAGGAFAGGYQMGTVVWHVNVPANNDGADIISGLLNPGIDGFFNATFDDMDNSVLFRSATVNLGDFVPEPAGSAWSASRCCAGGAGDAARSWRKR